MQGYPERSPQLVKDALALSEQLENIPNMAYALAASCFFHHYLKDVDWLLEKTVRLIKISQQEGFLLWLPVAMIFHGWAVAKKDGAVEGMAEMQKGLELLRKTETTVIMPHVMTMMAEIYSQEGQFDKALAALEIGFIEAINRSERHMEPELYRLKAEIILRQDQEQQILSSKVLSETTVQQAETYFQQALEVARQQDALMLELRAATGLSRLWQYLDRQRDAHRLLFDVYSRFTEGWTLADLRNAKLLLDNLALEPQR